MENKDLKQMNLTELLAVFKSNKQEIQKNNKEIDKIESELNGEIH
jgi:hypothetical protein